jgi:hypothetical protein
LLGTTSLKKLLRDLFFIHEKKKIKKKIKHHTFGLKGRDFNHYIIFVLENIVQEKYLKHE